jgi:large subunit ribosomal protein L19
MASNKNVITAVNAEERKNLSLRSGDTIRVWQKIKEKDKTRLQAFEGLVLARKHGTEAGGTFTVRKVMDGVGVEKIFPLYSPIIDKIEVLRRSKVRRAKLYFVREKAAKEIRRGLRKMLALEPGMNTDVKMAAPVAEAVAHNEAQS